MLVSGTDDVQLFLAEVEDLLVVMETGLIHLEKHGYHQQSLNEVFRAAHTIKGGAAMLGISCLAEATHLMEDLLDAIRTDQAELAPEVLEVLFACLDWLSQGRDRLGRGELPEEDPDLTRRLGQLCSSWRKPNPHREVSTGPSPAQGHVLEIQFSPDAPLLSVRAFQALALLREHFRVTGSRPTEEDIELDRCGPVLQVFLANEPGETQVAPLIQQLPDVVSFRLESANTAGPEAPTTAVSPSRTVRVSVELLDELLALAGELVVDRARLSETLNRLTPASVMDMAGQIREIANHMGRLTSQLQEGVMRGRLVPLRQMFRKFPRLVRDLSRTAGKDVDLVITGENTELDRSVMEAIDDPLVHLIRNAIDHGLETPQERAASGKPRVGRVELSAGYAQGQAVITVADDGRGMDLERVRRVAVDRGLLTEEASLRLTPRQVLDLVFSPGFSTASQVTEVSGRGVGLDVVRTNLRRINGRIELETRSGQGTRFHLYLPLTLAIIRALLVSSDRQVYALPVSSVLEVVAVNHRDVYTVTGRPMVAVRGRMYPLVQVGALMESQGLMASPYAVLTRTHSGVIALGVGGIVGEQEIVIKELGSYIGQVSGITGAAVLGDGSLALIVDPSSLLEVMV
ncbi:MAG: chemotaxis protein CheA [Bacillota bacterium]